MMMRSLLRNSFLGAACLSAVSFMASAQDASTETGLTGLKCNALTGTEQVLTENNETYLIFGEIHGTREAPRAFGEIICEAAKQGPTVVGIERPANLTRAMQTFVDSDGSDDARFNLLRGFFDGTDWGLSSQAFLDLFVRMQELKAQGADIRMIGFTSTRIVGEGSQTPYEKALAGELQRASARNPDARILVLVGNLHARLESYPELGDRPGFDPMAMHLPEGEVLSFNIAHTGGTAHMCGAEGCGPLPVDDKSRPYEDGLMLTDRDSRYNGIWNIGPITASPPVGKRY